MDSPLKPIISDSDLLAYLDGSAAPELVQQIKQSATHRQRAQALARERAEFARQLFRYPCPDSLSLAEYFTGQLKRGEAHRIRDHLAECPHCRRELLIHSAFLKDEEEVTEATLLDRVKLFVAQLVKLPEQGSDLVPAFSLRGDADAPRVFRTEAGSQIALTIRDDLARPGYRGITGLVMDAQMERIRLDLWQEVKQVATHVATVAADRGGNFTLTGLSPGEYELITGDSNVLIHIERFSV